MGRVTRWKALFIRSGPSLGSRFPASPVEFTTSQNNAVIIRRSPRISRLPGEGTGLAGPISLGLFGSAAIAISLTASLVYHPAEAIAESHGLAWTAAHGVLDPANFQSHPRWGTRSPPRLVPHRYRP